MSNRPRNTAVAASILLAASLSSAVAQTPQTPPAGQRGGGRGPATPPLIMTTAAWEDGGVIPDKYTQAAGANAVSPKLDWSQVAPGRRASCCSCTTPSRCWRRGRRWTSRTG
jgi:hypothetical protein